MLPLPITLNRYGSVTLSDLQLPIFTRQELNRARLYSPHSHPHSHACSPTCSTPFSSCGRGRTYLQSPFNSRSYTPDSCTCSKRESCRCNYRERERERDRCGYECSEERDCDRRRRCDRDEEIQLRVISGRDEYDVYISERCSKGDIYDMIERKEGGGLEEVYVVPRGGRESNLRDVDARDLYDYAREGMIDSLVVVGDGRRRDRLLG